ncbi:hypothetical protein [Comamonas testosteroni]|uniref:hypothetical protein n=1 Tax=Comamonas testosteroni TaxID=285 RepID=UPI0005B35EB2|nr:hypothetical protein [Comamonas testosteroni]
MELQITARIERRTWYVDGKYLGDKAEFVADSGETAKELTGDFFGEWEGTRHFDGEAILAADMAREIEKRGLYLKNWPAAQLGESFCYPCKLGDWGEFRIVTNAVMA